MALDDIKSSALTDETIKNYLTSHSRFSASFVNEFASLSYAKRLFEKPQCNKTILILAASSPSDYFAQRINAEPNSLTRVMKHAYIHGARKVFSYLQMQLINNESLQ